MFVVWRKKWEDWGNEFAPQEIVRSCDDLEDAKDVAEQFIKEVGVGEYGLYVADYGPVESR